MTEQGGTLGIQGLDCGRLFDEIPCFISIQDRMNHVLQANRKLIEEFGDPVSKPCYAVYKGRTERCTECPVDHTFEDGKEHVTEETIFDRQGMPHEVVVNTRPLRNCEGAIVAVIQLFTDITLQKELENRLHDSLVRFHNLFDLVPCYISVQDCEFHIIGANRLFRESFGARPGDHCYEIYKKRSAPCLPCPVAETFQDGRIRESEEVLIDDSGKQLRVVVHTAPIRDAQGKITSVMELSDDITELRTLEEKLASLGRLVGGIAHSIKNILEGLRGGIYVGNVGFRDNNMTDIRTGWQMVERNVTRISGMIMDMLYCAKERSPRRLPVSLSKIAKEVLDLHRTRALDSAIRLETEINDVDTILGEPRDIHALLSNLISNGIDACLADQIEQKTHGVLTRIFREGDRAVIEVQDNGTGMDDETLGKLFATFFSTKGSFGTGLGLLVCRKVSTEHGGTISVRSVPGEGSTFTVKLPLEAKP